MKLDIGAAIQIYYENTEIGNSEIKRIFGCSDSSVRKFKKKAQEEMVAKGATVWFSQNVNTRCAFSAWGLDIVELERRFGKLKKYFGTESA